jgi:hypothetical protein
MINNIYNNLNDINDIYTIMNLTFDYFKIIFEFTDNNCFFYVETYFQS